MVKENMKYILATLLLLSAAPCFAKWADIPLKTVVTNSDLIVVATLTNVQQVTTNGLVYCQGDLKVTEVLKGTKAKSVVLKWVYSIPPESISVDHSSLEGKPILWLLKQEKDRSFSAHYYKRIQNVDKKNEIKRIIKKNHNK